MTENITEQPVLQIDGLSKAFNQVVANNNISFDVLKGEVHCLLGENGAGKSTLAKCIYGAYKADSGTIRVKGEVVDIDSPKDAIKLKIGMVHQHFVLVPPMTALENIIVGTDRAKIYLDLGNARRKIESICRNYDLDIDLDSRADELSVGQQQWVEILKALYVGVDILILDEPTAVLTPQETEKLFNIFRQMTSEGISIILITHKLHEVMDISDRVTVLRKGEVVALCNTSDVSRQELARLMVGRDVVFRVPKEDVTPGDLVLSLKELQALRDNGVPALVDFSLDLHRREILGLAGVGGNGQDELFDVIVGVRELISGGVFLEGKNIDHLSPSERLKIGIASIPPDRIKQGLLMGFAIEDNLILGFQYTSRFTNNFILNEKKIREFANKSIEAYQIATSGPEQIAKELSGGNLQKVILARELSHHIEVVVASSPTRGIDVGATQYVHERLVELRDKGAGILLISEDLDEILNVSDRIAVIYKGVIMGVMSAEDADRENIGLMMAGIQPGDE
jgi:ABC-type uncharacterized transport system ATPase subunit